MRLNEFVDRLYDIGATAVFNHNAKGIRPYSVKVNRGGLIYWFHSNDPIEALTQAEAHVAEPTDGDREYESWGIAA